MRGVRARAAELVRSWGGVALVIAAGAGTTLALGMLARGEGASAAVTAAAVLPLFAVLLAAGWRHVGPFVLLAVSLPLPALVSTDRLRLSPALVVTGLVALAWVLRRAPGLDAVDLRALPRRSVTLLVATVLVATVLAAAPLPAVRESVSLALLLLVLVAAIDELGARPAGVASLASVLAGVAAVSGLAAGLQTVGVLPSPFDLADTGFHRATIGFDWPNEAAMFLAMLLPFSVFAVAASEGAWARALALVGLAATLLGLAATFSRGSWIAVLGAPAVFLLLGRWWTVVRVWIVAAATTVVLDLASGGAISTRAMMTLTDPLVGQRFALTAVGLIMFRENPFLGIGPGGFGAHLESYGTRVPWLWEYVGSAHNTYVQMAAETGVVGLLAFLIVLLAIFRVLLRSARAAQADPTVPRREKLLRGAVLWSFTTACLLAGAEWILAQGVGQLVMLTAAMGLALAPSGGFTAPVRVGGVDPGEPTAPTGPHRPVGPSENHSPEPTP